MCVCERVSGCVGVFVCVFYAFKFGPVRVRTRGADR